MELALNLVWVTISVAALLWWIRLGSGRRVARSELFQGVVVLACVLVLLFPVVSASDDLHANVAAVEDSFFAARKMKAVLQGSACGVATTLPMLLLQTSVLAMLAVTQLGWVRQYEPPYAAVVLAESHLSRAPPVRTQ